MAQNPTVPPLRAIQKRFKNPQEIHPVKLFLLRHAKARDTWPDAERSLDETGILQAEKLCSLLDPREFANVAQIWHSPYLRTRQTAEIFREKMNLSAHLAEERNITPEDSPQNAARMIAAIAGFGADLMVVSHNPLLENLAHTLLGGKRGAYVPFGKCTMASLTLIEEPSPYSEYGEWILNFLVSPSIFVK